MSDELHIETDGNVSLAETNPSDIFRFVDSESVMIQAYPSYLWKPQPDITAYELALCLRFLVAQSAIGISSLPAEALRHFEEVTV